MKHIKKYKIYENDSVSGQIVSDIKDILRDCEDLGLSISIDFGRFLKKSGYLVTINSVPRRYNIPAKVQFKDILPNIQHLISYMDSVGYNNFNYVDTVSGFNNYYKIVRDEWLGEDVPRIASEGEINNILPSVGSDSDSMMFAPAVGKKLFVGFGKMIFFKG